MVTIIVIIAADNEKTIIAIHTAQAPPNAPDGGAGIHTAQPCGGVTGLKPPSPTHENTSRPQRRHTGGGGRGRKRKPTEPARERAPSHRRPISPIYQINDGIRISREPQGTPR